MNKELIERIDKLLNLYEIEEFNHDLTFLKTKYKVRECIYDKILLEKPYKLFRKKFQEWELKKEKAEQELKDSFNKYYETLMNYSKKIDKTVKNII